MKKFLLTNEATKNNQFLALFGYQEVSRKSSIFKGYSTFTYKKEKDLGLGALESKYMIRSAIPFFFVVFPIVIAFILGTTYLVLNFALGASFDKLLYFFILMIPAFLFLLTGTFISFIRYFNTLKNMQSLATITLIKQEINKYETGSGRQE